MEAGETLDATVVNMRFVKPLDEALVLELAATHDLIVTIEENAVIGGAGAEVARALENAAQPIRTLRLGIGDVFIDHGEQRQLNAIAGLDAKGIVDAISARSHQDR